MPDLTPSGTALSSCFPINICRAISSKVEAEAKYSYAFVFTLSQSARQISSLGAQLAQVERE